MFGVDCSSGDTFNDGQTSYSMVRPFLPIPPPPPLRERARARMRIANDPPPLSADVNVCA